MRAVRRSLLIGVYGLSILLFLLFFWYYGLRGQNRDLEEGPVGLAGDIQEVYVMVMFQSELDYWRSIMKGFEDAALNLNVSVEFRGATQYDAHEEVVVLEQVIAKKPAGIAVTAINPEALNASIDKAVQEGIPIVLFDSGAPASKAYAFYGTDNYKAGTVAAREMARLLGGKGEVAVITQPTQLNHQERTEGFRDTIAREFPDIRVVEVADGKGEIIGSRDAAREILRKYPEVDGLFATQANGGVGIGMAVKEMGLAGQKVIIGFDTDKGTLDLVKEGTINATLAQGTWNMGYWSLMGLFHLRHNLVQTGDSGSNTGHPLPPFVDTGITIVTQQNVDQFYAK